MPDLRVSRNIVPIGELKVHTARVIRTAREGAAVVITQHGRAAAVVLSPAEYDRLVERDHVVSAVAEGLADVAAGRVADDDALDDWFARLGTAD